MFLNFIFQPFCWKRISQIFNFSGLLCSLNLSFFYHLVEGMLSLLISEDTVFSSCSVCLLQLFPCWALMSKAFLKCMLIFGCGLTSNRMDYRTCGWSSSASLLGLGGLAVGLLLRYLLNRSDSPKSILWVLDWRIKGLGPLFWEISGERAQGSLSVCIFFSISFWYDTPTYSCVSSSPEVSLCFVHSRE